MRPFLRFCASCAFLRPSLLVLIAAFAGHLAAQPANVQADPTTGALFRPAAATFISGNSLLTTSAAAAAYQPLDADLTSWAAVVRAGGFDTFVATPSSANLATLVTGETGTGALVFGTSPTFTTPTLGAATATSITGATDLTLAGGSTGASLVLGQGTNADATIAYKGTGKVAFNRWVAASATAPAALAAGSGAIYFQANGSVAGTQDSWVFDTGYTDQSYRFKVAGTDKMVIAANTGNLLIGTTTDATSLAGGLIINGSGTGAASSGTNTGALRVTGGVGVSGALNVGGAATFGGAVNITKTGEAEINSTGTSESYHRAIASNATGLSGFLLRTGTTPQNWYLLSNYSTTGHEFVIRDQTAGINALTLTKATGAATFAGAVTIAGTVIHTLSATPASASAAGTVGTMSWDANYIYICTATNTWKRVAIATW